MYEDKFKNLHKYISDLLCTGRIASAPEACQVSVTLDGVGEVQNSFFQLTAQRSRSSLREDYTYAGIVIVKHISVPHFKPQLLTHLHRAKVIGGVPHWVVVVHHRVRLLVHFVVEDLHVGVCLCEGICPQACRPVDRQCESSSAGT